MTEIRIKDEDYASLRNQVIVITGCSSGLGLATVELLLKTGAKVIGGDLNDPPPYLSAQFGDAFLYQKTSVTSWPELSALFKTAHQKYSRVDHAFANAGIAGRPNYLEDKLDAEGNLLEPDHAVYEIMFKGVVNTVALAMHYIRRQESGGSIVVTGSASSFQRFRMVDYAAAKHGVVGFVRGLASSLHASKNQIRINAIAPSWTLTGMVSKEVMDAIGQRYQLPDVPARSVALLMADPSRNGQLIYSWEGKYKEIDETLMRNASEVIDGQSDDAVVAAIIEFVKAQRAEQ